MPRKAKNSKPRKSSVQSIGKPVESKMGCPILYSTEMIIAALQKHNGLVYLAAKAIGCTPQAIYARAKAEPCIQECIESQRGEFVDTAEDKLRDAVEKKAPWAIALVVKTLGRDRGYVERVENRMGGDASAPPIKTEQNAISLEELSLETRKAILQELRAKKEAQQQSTETPSSPEAKPHS